MKIERYISWRLDKVEIRNYAGNEEYKVYIDSEEIDLFRIREDITTDEEAQILDSFIVEKLIEYHFKHTFSFLDDLESQIKSILEDDED